MSDNAFTYQELKELHDYLEGFTTKVRQQMERVESQQIDSASSIEKKYDQEVTDKYEKYFREKILKRPI